MDKEKTEKEMYDLWFEVSGKPSEKALLRLYDPECTELGQGIPADVDRSKTPMNNGLIVNYQIIPNEDYRGGRTKKRRYVEGVRVVFAQIFKESLTTYNRRQKRKDRRKDVDTYFDRCHQRWQKTYDSWYIAKKGTPEKDKAYKKIFNYSKEITIRVGENAKKAPSKMDMDMFAMSFLKWFQEQFPQMQVYLAVVCYDEQEKRKVDGENIWIGKAPALHIGFIPVALNEDGKGMDKKVGWTKCLKQSMKDDSGFVFSAFRRKCLAGCAKAAKSAGFKLSYVSNKYEIEDC